MSFYFTGLVIGVFSFLVIGLFHPIVIKVEYYTGTCLWWVFFLVGIVGCIASILTENVIASSLSSILSFTCFWSIKELFEQQERVKKGWFPKNPKRRY